MILGDEPGIFYFMKIRFEFARKGNVETDVQAYFFKIMREYGIAGERQVGIATRYSDETVDSFMYFGGYPHNLVELTDIANMFSNVSTTDIT